jgi:hypothetical protein
MDPDGMRAGDDDRQAVADRLKAALDEGRLDLGEYDDRLRRTYAAKTYGDLQELVTDLPGSIPAQRAQVEPHGAAPAPVPPAPNWVGGYAGVVGVCVLIWAITSVSSGELQYFWPVWMLIPLVLAVAGRMTGRGR